MQLTCKLLGVLVDTIFLWWEKDHFKQKSLLCPQVPFKKMSCRQNTGLLEIVIFSTISRPTYLERAFRNYICSKLRIFGPFPTCSFFLVATNPPCSQYIPFLFSVRPTPQIKKNQDSKYKYKITHIWNLSRVV